MSCLSRISTLSWRSKGVPISQCHEMKISVTHIIMHTQSTVCVTSLSWVWLHQQRLYQFVMPRLNSSYVHQPRVPTIYYISSQLCECVYANAIFFYWFFYEMTYEVFFWQEIFYSIQWKLQPEFPSFTRYVSMHKF